MATAPTPTLAQGACPEGTSAAGSRPRGHPISYQISKECGWFPGASTPLRPACPAPPLSCKAPSRSPYSGIKAQWPPHQRPATWLPVPTAHLVWSAAALARVLESQDLHGSESASSPAQARHCLGASSRPLPLPCRHAAGRRLASGFSRARPAGRPWEGHSPPASHPAQGRPEGRPWARRPWWLQDPRWSCHQCSGPPPCTPKKRVPAGEAVSGAGEPSVWGTWAPQDRGPLAGRGRAQQGGPLLGPNPSGGGQDRFSRLPATAGTDSGPGHEVAAPLSTGCTEHPAHLLGQEAGWGLWLVLPPAGDLTALPFLRVTSSGGNPNPRRPEDNCTRTPGLQLHQEAGRLRLPSPAAPELPGENQVSPLGKTELAARDQRPRGCGEGTCPALPGRLPRASDLLPGPRRACSGSRTNQGGGGSQAPSGLLQAALKGQHPAGPPLPAPPAEGSGSRTLRGGHEGPGPGTAPLLPPPSPDTPQPCGEGAGRAAWQ